MEANKLDENQVRYALQIGDEARRMGINPDFVLPMVAAESKFDPRAVSPKGAIGLMQLMPSTAKELGVNPYDISQNIKGGLTYLKQLSSLPDIGTNPVALLAAYNSGPNKAYLKTLDPKDIPEETAAYVRRINTYAGGTLPQPFIGLEGEAEGEGVGQGGTLTEGERPAPASELDYQRLMLDAAGGLTGAATAAGLQFAGSKFNLLGRALEGMAAMKEPSSDGGKSSGQKWAEKVTGYVDPEARTVSEQARSYNRAKTGATGQLYGKPKISGRLPNMYGPPAPGEPKSMVDRLLQQQQEREAEKKALAAQVKRQQSPLNMAGRFMTSPAGKVVGGALGGISAAEQAQQAINKYAEQDMPMAAAYGTGALGSAMMAIPHTGTQILGGAMAASPLVMYAYRKAQEKGMPSGLPATYSPYFK
jgi:hypothetical protein